MERIYEMEINQWKKKEELDQLQKLKLKRILVHAFENVPFYRQRFEKLGIDKKKLHHANNFLKIPILTKKEINENRNRMISYKENKNKLIPNSTSGSTGEALYFYSDARSWAYRRATVIRNQNAIGIKLGDRSARIWGAPMDIETAMAIRGRIHAWINNIMFLSSYELSNKKLKIYERKLNRFKPRLLISYPGPLVVFSEYLIKENIKIPSIKAIISSAETLYSWQKDLIENAFFCPVYNRYGCREFGDIAHECEKREGLHINSDRFYVEILNEKLRPAKHGNIGEIIITDLDNYGMPLIRYRIGDLASFKNKLCSCGRNFPLLNYIEGRTLDIVKAPNGNRLGGTFWTILFKSRPGIKSFQVIQDRLEKITIKYIKNNEIANIDFSTFEKLIKDKCGQNFTVHFEEVFSIPKTISGKTRIVISKIKAMQ